MTGVIGTDDCGAAGGVEGAAACGADGDAACGVVGTAAAGAACEDDEVDCEATSGNACVSMLRVGRIRASNSAQEAASNVQRGNGQTSACLVGSPCRPRAPPRRACSSGWCVHCLSRNLWTRIGEVALISERFLMGSPERRPTSPTMH